eukprot:CAMPEP_0178389024 /NCGR_PEP_ID=MMETSP0689_2-20121128/9895_1 /TAXON_ID=160604 /ORGANISM="Amphidinium massartii, Strain CS-259" /LENGTH=811 /DNA_ID=CAMNT_0020009445 /DNA_START=59 /DNA_END=2490 /DNA_ORIENTATION=+
MTRPRVRAPDKQSMPDAMALHALTRTGLTVSDIGFNANLVMKQADIVATEPGIKPMLPSEGSSSGLSAFVEEETEQSAQPLSKESSLGGESRSRVMVRSSSEEALLMLYRDRPREGSPSTRKVAQRLQEKLQPHLSSAPPMERIQSQALSDLDRESRDVAETPPAPHTPGALWKTICHRVGLRRGMPHKKVSLLNPDTESLVIEDLAKDLADHLSSQYGLLEVAVVHAALELGMCSDGQVTEHVLNSLYWKIYKSRWPERAPSKSCIDAVAQEVLHIANLETIQEVLPAVPFPLALFEQAMSEVFLVNVSQETMHRLYEHLDVQRMGTIDLRQLAAGTTPRSASTSTRRGDKGSVPQSARSGYSPRRNLMCSPRRRPYSWNTAEGPPPRPRRIKESSQIDQASERSSGPGNSDSEPRKESARATCSTASPRPMYSSRSPSSTGGTGAVSPLGTARRSRTEARPSSCGVPQVTVLTTATSTPSKDQTPSKAGTRNQRPSEIRTTRLSSYGLPHSKSLHADSSQGVKTVHASHMSHMGIPVPGSPPISATSPDVRPRRVLPTHEPTSPVLGLGTGLTRMISASSTDISMREMAVGSSIVRPLRHVASDSRLVSSMDGTPSTSLPCSNVGSMFHANATPQMPQRQLSAHMSHSTPALTAPQRTSPVRPSTCGVSTPSPFVRVASHDGHTPGVARELYPASARGAGSTGPVPKITPPPRAQLPTAPAATAMADLPTSVSFSGGYPPHHNVYAMRTNVGDVARASVAVPSNGYHRAIPKAAVPPPTTTRYKAGTVPAVSLVPAPGPLVPLVTAAEV